MLIKLLLCLSDMFYSFLDIVSDHFLSKFVFKISLHPSGSQIAHP